MPAAGQSSTPYRPGRISPLRPLLGLPRPVRLASAALAGALVLAMVGVAAAALMLVDADHGPTAAWAKSSGHDAVWLGRTWATGSYTREQFRELTGRLAESGISDVYVFAGQLDANGHLDKAGYAKAGPFLAALHAALPRVRASAWLSGVMAGDGPPASKPPARPGPISLNDPSTRAAIVTSAAAVLKAGFSGIHYDLEPVADGDAGYLRLLAATSRLKPRPVPLSVAVPKLEPLAGMRLPWQLIGIGPVYWTPGYLGQVARLVDQVDLMAYDTTMPSAALYGGFVVRQTELALSAVPRRVRLLIGVPCYHYTTFAHSASAETAAAAIGGIRVALTADGRHRDFGIAMFAYYSSTPADWRSYRADWLRPR